MTDPGTGQIQEEYGIAGVATQHPKVRWSVRKTAEMLLPIGETLPMPDVER